MGNQKNVDMSNQESDIKIVKDQNRNQDKKNSEKEKTDTKKKKPTQKKIRSKKYQAVKSKVDKTRKYELHQAIELVKKTSYTNFIGTISAHIEVKEEGMKIQVTFPHKTGKDINVAIVNEATIKKIDSGDYDFDVLLCRPKDIKKITKYARFLGPQGLMPNPKNGTLTPNPELKKKELESGVMNLKTEKKSPLIHTPVGKVNMETQKIADNIKAILNQLKKKAKKMTISATMSPGVKVDLREFK